MVILAYSKILGTRLRALREERGWSQSACAQQVPLSQKQWSRLEVGDVSLIDRDLLIRLAEIFSTPIKTGELNQWLHAFGYRPYVVPMLPLLPNYRDLLATYFPYPAMILDWGRYFRSANAMMEQLYHFRLEELHGIRRNWLWHYFHPTGLLYRAYPPDSAERILNRLFWDWQPYSQEPWNQQLRGELEAALNIRWSDLRERYHIPSEPIAAAVSEVITIPGPEKDSVMLFQNRTVTIPARPDLYTIVYHPLNAAATAWYQARCADDVPR